MLVPLLDQIKNPILKSFAFRTYNTFKSVILPIVLPLVLIQLQNNPNDITCLLRGEFWLTILYAVVVALVGASVAGLDKVTRMEKED